LNLKVHYAAEERETRRESLEKEERKGKEEEDGRKASVKQNAAEINVW